MKAARLHAPGDLRIEDVPKPEPRPGEVLVQIEVALTDGTDLKTYRRGHPVLLREAPAAFGHEFCGLADGRRVVAANSAPCGACDGCARGGQCLALEFLTGAYADWIVVPERIAAVNLHEVPPGVEPEVAAMVEPLACCLRGVERAGVQAGDRVAILGAGPIGLMLAACVADAGGWPVIVGGRDERRALAEDFGAEPGDGQDADVVIEAAGTEAAWLEAQELVRPGGTVLLFGGLPREARPTVDAFRLHYQELTLRGSFHHTPATVRVALGFLASGAYPWAAARHPPGAARAAAGAVRESAARPAQGRRRAVNLRQLNRTLLLRQGLLARRRAPVPAAVARLVALQAQYAPSPYVALWSRLEGFRKEQLTRALAAGTVVKAGSLRTTLHVMARTEFPAIMAAYIDSQRGRLDGIDVEALVAALPDRPFTSREFFELGHRALGTDDRWTVAFAGRAIPTTRTVPLGPWPHTKPSPSVLWREPLPEPDVGAAHVVRSYLAAYGPASREDIQQFTGFRMRQIDPALEGLRESDGLFDVPRARRADRRRAGARPLPAGVRLDHPRPP